MAFLDAFQGNLLADFAAIDLRARRAALLYNVALPYSAEIARLFTETFQERGGEVVAAETFTTDQTAGFGKQLRRIANARPDVILLPVRSSTVRIVLREARAMGIPAQVLGSDTWDVATIAPMPEADGSYVVHQWHTDLRTERTTAFVAAYRSTFGASPRATAALTYDAVHLAAEAIARAGSLDGERIADAIAATPSFDGASGSLRFAGSHDPARSGVLSSIRNGNHGLLRVVSALP
jgi:branched-chain amino acid transport system substrate-binding protein